MPDHIHQKRIISSLHVYQYAIIQTDPMIYSGDNAESNAAIKKETLWHV